MLTARNTTKMLLTQALKLITSNIDEATATVASRATVSQATKVRRATSINGKVVIDSGSNNAPYWTAPAISVNNDDDNETNGFNHLVLAQQQHQQSVTVTLATHQQPLYRNYNNSANPHIANHNNNNMYTHVSSNHTNQPNVNDNAFAMLTPALSASSAALLDSSHFDSSNNDNNFPTITTIITTTTTSVSSSSSFGSATNATTSVLSTQQNFTNNNGTLLDDDNEMLRTIETIGTVLCFYYIPILVFTGSIGNILSVFVFFKTKLRKLSSSFYLAALAVSDTCFLFGLFAQWLNFVDVHFYNRDFFCQFFTFSSYLACFCSAWFVVAFTVERFIAVAYPLKRQTMCTVRRAKIVLVGLTTVGCFHCLPFWISSTPIYSPKLEATICDMKSDYKEFMTLVNYWDTIVVFAVPFTTIVVLNTFTGCTVWKFATVRRTLTMQKRKSQLTKDALTASTYRITSLKRQKSTSTCSHPNGQNNVTQENCCEITRKSGRRKITNSSQLKVTKMLLIVSTVFVCLNLPSCVMRIKTYLETQTSANEKTTVVLQYIFQLLFITNFGINFVLYCVSGQNFRKAVLSMFRRVSSTQREGTTQVTVSEYYRNSGGGGTGASTRRRLMTQHCWNEIHELHPLK